MFTRREKPETAQRESASTNGNTGYMAELDEWLDFTIFEPLENVIASGDTKGAASRFQREQTALKAQSAGKLSKLKKFEPQVFNAFVRLLPSK